MTATITPASLRAHAEYMERVHLDGISAEELLQEAARLEAESARDEEAERLAQALFSGTAGHFVTASTWDAASDHSRNAFRAAARAALDFLAADGRLLPESGVATVAQHENVAADQHKWVYCEYQDFTRDCEFRCEAPGCDWSGQDKAGHAEHVHLIEAQERLRRNPETIASVQKAQAERHLDVRVEVVPPTSAPDILVHSHGPAEGRGWNVPSGWWMGVCAARAWTKPRMAHRRSPGRHGRTCRRA
ncbi:hypothetical protein GS421_04595 [Rhodococcus hoagii]|nr:hypothetical protein [Prescottella equi]